MKAIPRRMFLKNSARWFGLAGLAGFAVHQEAKRRRLKNNPDCIKLFTCRDCIEFNGCTKTKAEHYRKGNL